MTATAAKTLRRPDTCSCGATVDFAGTTRGDTGTRYLYEHCGSWWNEGGPWTPNCEAVEQRIRWDQVQEGDLVLENGRFELVDRIHYHPENWFRVHVRFDEISGFTPKDPAGLVAVGRYIETT